MAVIITNPNLRTALNKGVAVALYVIYEENIIKEASHKYIKFLKLNRDKKIITCYCNFTVNNYAPSLKLTIDFEINDDDLYAIENRI